jgi:hypothetical protein
MQRSGISLMGLRHGPLPPRSEERSGKAIVPEMLKLLFNSRLAGTLARMGRRVLLMDNDPQGSLTQGLLGPDATRDLDPFETIYARMALG